MTVRDYLTQQLAKFGVTDADIDLILLESDLDGDQVLTSSADTIAIKKAMFFYLPNMLAGLKDITEGGYSVKWNTAGLKAWISALASFLNLPDPFAEAPAKIRGRSPW